MYRRLLVTCKSATVRQLEESPEPTLAVPSSGERVRVRASVFTN